MIIYMNSTLRYLQSLDALPILDPEIHDVITKELDGQLYSIIKLKNNGTNEN